MVNAMQVTSTKPLNSTSPAPEGRTRNEFPGLSKGREIALTNSDQKLPSLNKSASTQNISQRHREWSNLSDAQATLSRLQSMSKTFRYTQDALLSLARDMTSKLPHSAGILHQISSLMTKLDTQTQIDRNFLPASASPKASYKLDRINLVSPKDQSEKIQIRLPDNSQVNISIDKGQSSEETFKDLSQAFRDIGIKAARSDQGSIVFTGPEKLMDSAWIFQGQGVRVPAGSPVPVTLKPVPDPLQNISDNVRAGDMEASRQALRELLTEIGRKAQVVARQLESVIANSSPIDVEVPDIVSTENLAAALDGSDPIMKAKGLITQANVSRENVVDILSVL